MVEDKKAGTASNLEPFELERFFAKWEFEAKHLLCCSDCEPLAMSNLIEHADAECRKLWDDLVLGYTMSNGSDELRKEIATLYDNVQPDDINILVPEEGIYLSMLALLSAGDHVVVTFPGYQSLYEVARSLGCHVHYWKPRIDPKTGRVHFDTEDLRSIVEAHPIKLVVVNFPHNPTGKTLSRDQHADVVEMCRNRGAFLFSDEMYRLLEYEDKDRLPAAVDCYDKAMVLCGSSKSLSCPGLRIGWIASKDGAFMKRLAELKDYTTICPSGPSEVLALMAIRQRDRIVRKNLEIISQNIAKLEKFCETHSAHIAWDPPAAGSIAFPRILCSPDQGIGSWCEDLVRSRDVLLLPASVYKEETLTEDRRVRFGLGRAGIDEGLERLAQFFKESS